MSTVVLHKASSRYIVDHGWLKSAHTFSFHNYYDPLRMNFGALRVLNEDIVSGGKGFGEHPHDNMEIISLPLQGSLKHEDSLGNTAIINPGEIQVMSAGTGLYHTEFNKNADAPVHFLQIWLYPNQMNVSPRYDQYSYENLDKHNKWLTILSPNPDKNGVWIYQNAWFHLADLDQGVNLKYRLKDPSNSIYLFIIGGDVHAGGHVLQTSDGLGFVDFQEIDIRAVSDAKVLLMEVSQSW